jgi:hypothetical protein
VWVQPIREPALLDELAERVTRFPRRARVIVDGAAPAEPVALADALVEVLRLRGRPVLRVSAADFLRPASVRLEHGHTDPDELLQHGWLDVAGLRREVLEPARPDGSGQVLPRLWNSQVDRAYRAQRVELAANGVLLLAGALLLGRGLPAELTVHLHLSAAALARRLDPQLHWTLPAYRRYDAEHDPSAADVLVLADDRAGSRCCTAERCRRLILAQGLSTEIVVAVHRDSRWTGRSGDHQPRPATLHSRGTRRFRGLGHGPLHPIASQRHRGNDDRYGEDQLDDDPPILEQLPGGADRQDDPGQQRRHHEEGDDRAADAFHHRVAGASRNVGCEAVAALMPKVGIATTRPSHPADTAMCAARTNLRGRPDGCALGGHPLRDHQSVLVVVTHRSGFCHRRLARVRH